jgi:RNA polymerase sigma-70 factor (sigma-E family)
MRLDAEQEYGDYVTARAAALVRFAYLTCGDWHRAEDGVQTALTKLYLAWPRLRDRGAIDAYVRRIVLRVLIDERRLGWFRRERSTERLPDRASVDPTAATSDKVAILAALSRVPPRQRVVLVLRFWEDQSVEQVADLLGCSTGTVKSQSARGLDKLRALLSESVSTPAQGAS